MTELGLLGDHQGDEEPALQCRAPPEGRGEPGGASGGLGGPGGPRQDPPDSDSGSVAQQGADVVSFPGGGVVLRTTDEDAHNWLPRALRNAIADWRYRRRDPPPPQPHPRTGDDGGDGRTL